MVIVSQRNEWRALSVVVGITHIYRTLHRASGQVYVQLCKTS